jgi:hypothetical protein
MPTEKDNLPARGLTDDELAAQQADELPDREAMSSLLDLDVILDATLDAAAPIDAAVAANANVAAPIDAAVAANVTSTGSTAIASADQDAAINQTLNGTATAVANQDSDIEQGDNP